jgi:hypothetical protein
MDSDPIHPGTDPGSGSRKPTRILTDPQHWKKSDEKTKQSVPKSQKNNNNNNNNKNNNISLTASPPTPGFRWAGHVCTGDTRLFSEIWLQSLVERRFSTNPTQKSEEIWKIHEFKLHLANVSDPAPMYMHPGYGPGTSYGPKQICA